MNFVRIACLFLLTLFCTTISLGQEKKSLLLVYNGVVYFGSGQKRIAKKHQAELNKMARLLKENPKHIAWIAAHTDSVGDYTFNEKLSDARAENVRQALLARDVPQGQLQIYSYGEYAPLASNATQSGRAKNRRVTIEITKPFVFKPKKERFKYHILGQVRDLRTNEPIPNVRIKVDGMGYKDTVWTTGEGRYEFILKQPMQIRVIASAPKYFFEEQSTVVMADTPAVVDFKLKPAVVGKQMQLGGLYFKAGTPVLLPSSGSTLQSILEFLKENKDLKVELAGHINKPGIPPVQENTASFQLSKNRAKAVYNYLTSMGVPESQVTYKGYGNWQMVYPKATTPEEMQMNRRVELKIIE